MSSPAAARAVTPPRYSSRSAAISLSPATPGDRGGRGSLERTSSVNKPIMLYLHENVPEYKPDGLPLLVNLGSLHTFTDLLDDCTSRLKMHKFAGQLFTPSGTVITHFAEIKAKMHLVVVAEKDTFKVTSLPVESEEEEVAADERVDTSNEVGLPALATQAFGLQVQMALGNVTDVMMADFGTKLAGYMAPSMECVVNPADASPGPTVIGDFGAVMATVGPLWLGFVNTSAENVSISAGLQGSSSVIVKQLYQNHLVDSNKVKIEGTANTMHVTHTLTYNAEQKISRWVQEYDAVLMAKARALESAANESIARLAAAAAAAAAPIPEAVPPEPAKAEPADGASALDKTIETTGYTSNKTAAAFARYDLNNDGHLDAGEVGKMMAALGFNVDASYVTGLLDTFGQGGTVTQEEFPDMWAHLGGDAEEAAADDDTDALQAAGKSALGELYPVFAKFDMNGRGSLSQMEITEMMKALGYKVDPSYIDGLMQMLGQFDTNHDGAIGPTEFAMVWEFLGGTPEMAADVMSEGGYDGTKETAAEAAVEASANPLKATFMKLMGGAEAVSTPQEAPPPRLPKSPPRLPRLPTGGKSTAA